MTTKNLPDTDKRHTDHPMLHIVNHPLVQIKLTEARDENTPHWRFCALVAEIASLMLYECTRDWPTRPRTIQTPMEQMTGCEPARPLTIVPILRAGLGMVQGMIAIMPNARVGHVGLYRDHDTLEPVEYYKRLPRHAANGKVLMLDPMLATGGSAVASATILKNSGCNDIKMVCLVAAPEGVQAMQNAHPDITIYTASLDRQLNEQGYILPGLGDAGDRIFGTEN